MLAKVKHDSGDKKIPVITIQGDTGQSAFNLLNKICLLNLKKREKKLLPMLKDKPKHFKGFS